MKVVQIRRKGIQWSLHADHMTVYLENPNGATQNH